MIEHLSYRKIERNDFEKICKLPQNAEELFFMFPKAEYPLNPNQLEAAVQSRFDATVILLNNEIVGFANFYEVKKHEHCSIGNVIVDSNYRKMGIGEYLIKTMENTGIEKYKVSAFHLSCFNTNTNGILLYSKLGYKPFDIEKWMDESGKKTALIKLKKKY